MRHEQQQYWRGEVWSAVDAWRCHDGRQRGLLLQQSIRCQRKLVLAVHPIRVWGGRAASGC